MQRIIDIAGSLLVVALLGLIGVNAFRDPVANERKWLSDQIASVALAPSEELRTEEAFETWQTSIAKRPQLWQPISPTPEAVKPPPPPECKPPTTEELKAKLAEQGIRFTKAQIGKKIKVAIGDSKRGEFIAEGESIKGFTVVSFDRTGVLLSTTFVCPDKKKLEIEFTVPRE